MINVFELLIWPQLKFVQKLIIIFFFLNLYHTHLKPHASEETENNN